MYQRALTIALFLLLPASAFAGERDPFESFLAAAPEQRSLDDMRLVAIVKSATPVALFEDKAGKGHFLRIGAVLGSGRVRAIYADRVVVEDQLRTWDGRVVRQTRVIALRVP